MPQPGPAPTPVSKQPVTLDPTLDWRMVEYPIWPANPPKSASMPIAPGYYQRGVLVAWLGEPLVSELEQLDLVRRGPDRTSVLL